MKRMSKRSSQRNVSAFSIPKRLHPISRCTWVDRRICMFFVYEDLLPLTTREQLLLVICRKAHKQICTTH